MSWKLRGSWLATALVGALAFTTGCTGEMAQCVVGQVISCPCVGGSTGVQSCQAGGTYGTCNCAGADAGAHDSGSHDASVDTIQSHDDGPGQDVFVPDSTPIEDVPAVDTPAAETGGPDVVIVDVPMDTITVVDSGPRDTGVDARPTGGLYARCVTSADCGTGFTCSTIFPGGLCTRSCVSDFTCSGGVCDTSLGCLPGCTPHGGLECDAFGSACYPYDTASTRFVCFPSCFPTGTTPPAGYTNTCIGGTTCDPQQLYCAATAAPGAIIGAPCTADGDCASGRCITEVDATSGAGTGYIGGQCYTVGRLPPLTDYVEGSPLPRGNCPANSVAIPFAGTDDEGDPSICLRSCVTDTDCGRAGYFCDHFGDPGMPAYTNGICSPINCRASGRTCPTGYHCVTDVSDAAVPPGHCEAG